MVVGQNATMQKGRRAKGRSRKGKTEVAGQLTMTRRQRKEYRPSRHKIHCCRFVERVQCCFFDVHITYIFFGIFVFNDIKNRT